ncbi:MAG: hypothetical protein J1F09_03285 [Oscillospiraceae bacterium]|nr:hypothetical protein [Oscillospiraceae bacterium]
MKLLDSLGAVDDELISEAMEYDLVCEGVSIRVERKPVRPWKYIAAAAACVAVLGGTFAAMRHIAPPIAPDDSVQSGSTANSGTNGTENSGNSVSGATPSFYDGVVINDLNDEDVISSGFYAIIGVEMPRGEVMRTLDVYLPLKIGEYTEAFDAEHYGIGTFADGGYDGTFDYRNGYGCKITVNVRRWEHVRSWNDRLLPAGVEHCTVNGAETLIIRQKGTDSFGEYTLLSAGFYKDNETAVSLQAYNIPIDEFITFLRGLTAIVKQQTEKPFPGFATAECPWYMPENADIDGLVFPADYTEEDLELQKFLKETADKVDFIESMFNYSRPAVGYSSSDDHLQFVFPQMEESVEKQYPEPYYPIADEYPQTKAELRKLMEEACLSADYIESELSLVSKAEMTKNDDGTYSVTITEGGKFDDNGHLSYSGRFMEIGGRLYSDSSGGKGGRALYWDSAKIISRSDTELVYFLVAAAYGVYAYYDAGLLVYEDGSWKIRMRNDYYNSTYYREKTVSGTN